MAEREIPNVIKALAQQVGMTPFDWAEHPDHITIIFVEGPKITFLREKTEKATITKLVAPSAPSAAGEAPAASPEAQSPHGSKPKAKKGSK